MIDFEALFTISYGLYIVCSGNENRGNGFISNTVFQVTSDPAKFAACCNKKNYTAEFIQESGVFSVSVLNVDASPELLGKFGYQSGRDTDKLKGLSVKYGTTGVPMVMNDSVALLEFRVVQTIDAGTHLIFIGELINAEVLDAAREPMTYLYYRQIRKGIAPKNAPTYIDKLKIGELSGNLLIKKFKCPVCGYIYNDGVENVKFENLPKNWICPICGCEKSDFIEI